MGLHRKDLIMQTNGHNLTQKAISSGIDAVKFICFPIFLKICKQNYATLAIAWAKKCDV